MVSAGMDTVCHALGGGGGGDGGFMGKQKQSLGLTFIDTTTKLVWLLLLLFLIFLLGSFILLLFYFVQVYLKSLLLGSD